MYTKRFDYYSLNRLLNRVQSYLYLAPKKYLGLYNFHHNTLDSYLGILREDSLKSTINLLEYYKDELSVSSNAYLTESYGRLAEVYSQKGLFDKALDCIQKGDIAYNKIKSNPNPFAPKNYDRESIDGCISSCRVIVVT